IRHTRGRSDLEWANLLGRMGQSSLVGYWAAGSFNSMAYFDEYWCIIFIFEAARRIVAKEVATPINLSYRPRPSLDAVQITARGAVLAGPERGGAGVDRASASARIEGKVVLGRVSPRDGDH